MFVSIGAAATYFGVSPSTLRRWEARKFLVPAFRTPGGHRRYLLKQLRQYVHQWRIMRSNSPSTPEIPAPQAVLYARVSAAKQKADLIRQIAHLQAFVHQRGWHVQKLYQDIASGINDHRRGLNRLLRDLTVLQPDYLVCAYPDRLSRFGTGVIETLCQIYSVQLVYTEPITPDQPQMHHLTQDLVAILTSFAGRIHRQRRGRYNRPVP